MNPLMVVKGLSFAYGKEQALSNISMSIPEGKFTSLIGPNGSGKTTLFRLLCGGLKAKENTVFYRGRPLEKMGYQERARSFAVVHQNEETKFPFRCLEYVCLGFYPEQGRFYMLSKKDLNIAYSLLEQFGISALAERWMQEVSGGERQKVILCRALAQGTKFLFLDEAFSALDIYGRLKATDFFLSLAQTKGNTILSIQHDLQMAYQKSDYIIALKEGRKVVEGPPKEVMTEQFFAEVFQVKIKRMEQHGFIILDTADGGIV